MQIRQGVLERPDQQRERRPEFMADVGEELRFEDVELGKLLALAGDLALVRLLLGDVAALGADEDDLAVAIAHGHQGGVDDDGFLTPSAAVDLGVPADEFPACGPPNGVPQALIDLIGDLPPESSPERLAFDVGELDPDRVERHLIDFEHRALRIEQADELHHRVERDSRNPFAIAVTRVGCLEQE